MDQLAASTVYLENGHNHTDPYGYKCDSCQKPYSCFESLVIHIETEHSLLLYYWLLLTMILLSIILSAIYIIFYMANM